MNTEKWAMQIDEISSSFNQNFGNLTIEKLNWKPNSKTWSVAQNIDHLIKINESYYPVVKQIKENNYPLPWTSRIGFFVSFFGKMILNSIQPHSKRKMKTFKIWEPISSNFEKTILTSFEKHQIQLKEMIKNSADLIKAKKIISSPANKYIVYHLDVAFDIIIAHEKRHLEQAKEVLKIQK